MPESNGRYVQHMLPTVAAEFSEVHLMRACELCLNAGVQRSVLLETLSSLCTWYADQAVELVPERPAPRRRRKGGVA